jgi:hypothetical protein
MHHTQWQDHGGRAGTPELQVSERPALFDGKIEHDFTTLE